MLSGEIALKNNHYYSLGDVRLIIIIIIMVIFKCYFSGELIALS